VVLLFDHDVVVVVLAARIGIVGQWHCHSPLKCKTLE
jgi:hypothetical protein